MPLSSLWFLLWAHLWLDFFCCGIPMCFGPWTSPGKQFWIWFSWVIWGVLSVQGQFLHYIKLIHLFVFLSFLGPLLQHMEIPRLGVQSELVGLWLDTPQPQRCRIWAMSATYTTAHGNAASLTHWERPGIELVTSWLLVGFVSAVPQWELHIFRLNFSSGFLPFGGVVNLDFVPRGSSVFALRFLEGNIFLPTWNIWTELMSWSVLAVFLGWWLAAGWVLPGATSGFVRALVGIKILDLSYHDHIWSSLVSVDILKALRLSPLFWGWGVSIEPTASQLNQWMSVTHSHFFFFFFGLFRAAPAAYGSSQARGQTSNQSCGHQPTHTEPQQWQFWTTSVIYTTATPILNPPSEARNRTRVLMDTSQVHHHWAMMETPEIEFLEEFHLSYESTIY